MVFHSRLCVRHKMLCLVILHPMRPDQPVSWQSLDRLVQLSSLSRSVVSALTQELATYDWFMRASADWASREGRRPYAYWLPRRDLVPEVPPHCTRHSARAANLRRGGAPPSGRKEF